jgi:hypothetical protein
MPPNFIRRIKPVSPPHFPVKNPASIAVPHVPKKKGRRSALSCPHYLTIKPL